MMDNRADSALSPSANLLLSRGNKSSAHWFNLVRMFWASPQSDSFEELAMPLFDQL